MKVIKVGIFSLSAFAYLASPAAALTIFNDQASFLAAVEPGFYLETFDTTATGSTPGPLPYSSAGFTYNVTLQSDPFLPSGLFPFTEPGGDPTDVFMSENNALNTVIFDFTSGNVTAVGGFFFTADIAGNIITADVIIDTDQTDPTALAAGGTTNMFLGFTSDTPFDFLSMIGDSTEVVAFPAANDFIVGTAASSNGPGDPGPGPPNPNPIVPEPSSYILAVVGLLLLGVIGGRRQTR